MKKFRAVITCILSLFLCVVLAGCGAKENKDVSNSKYVGTWKATKITTNGEEATAEEVFGGDYIMELKSDGTYIGQAGGETSKGTWTETDDGPKIYEDGNTKGTVYKADGDTLVVNLVIAKVVFVKQ